MSRVSKNSIEMYVCAGKIQLIELFTESKL
jgi:hypothetical protein